MKLERFLCGCDGTGIIILPNPRYPDTNEAHWCPIHYARARRLQHHDGLSPAWIWVLVVAWGTYYVLHLFGGF